MAQMNRMDHSVWDYYNNKDFPETLSDGAKWHYKRKLNFLASEANARYTWKGINYLLEKHKIDLDGKTVLDLGAGTGFTSIYFSVSGARKVVSLDNSADKTEVFRAFANQLPEEVQRSISINHGRTDEFEQRDRFDLIFAQESISHIVDEHLFDRLHNLLSPDGFLYITDNNNVLCNSYREEITDYWQRTENGPVGGHGHHTVEWVYRDLRRDLIHDWFPEIQDQDLEILADNTAYLYADFLKKSIEQYLLDGVYPKQKYRHGTPPIHPWWGYYMEKVFNPYELKNRLIDIGYSRCTLYGGNGIHKPWYLRKLIELIPLRVKYALRPHFALIAEK